MGSDSPLELTYHFDAESCQAAQVVQRHDQKATQVSARMVVVNPGHLQA